MAEPSPKDTQEQIRQAQQYAWQIPPQQPSSYPMATGGGYALPPSPFSLPIQNTGPQGSAKNKGITISMGRLSLLAVVFSLLILGALTFFGGFLLGIWFATPSQTYVPGVETPTLGLLPPQQSQQVTPTSATGSDALQNYAGQAGYATQSIVSNANVPNVPSFLNPLVAATQSAIGQQMGYKVQQQIGQRGQAPSPSAQPQTIVPLPSPNRAPPLQLGAPSASQPSRASIPASMSNQALSSAPKEAVFPSQEKGEYTVQLGVYASKDNASALMNHLQSLNLTSHITQSKDPNGSDLYYVHSGHYKDYNMAMQAASQFGAYNIPGAIVVNVSQNNKSAP